MAQIVWVICCSLFLFTLVSSQSMDGYYTYEEFSDKVKDYDYFFLDHETYQGRVIPCIKLSDPNGLENRKSILLVGGLNASPIALSQLFWNIDNIKLETEGDDESEQLKALLKTNHVYVVPMLNVDGYKFISDNWEEIKDEPALDSTRRKNMNSDECGDATYGVDLTRNF